MAFVRDDGCNSWAHLDPERMDEVLSRASREEADVYDFVWRHCQFYTTAEVIELVGRAIDQFLDQCTAPFVLFIAAHKWGSEQWMASVFLERLGRPRVIRRLDELPAGRHHVLLLDDAAYTGANLASGLDEQLYELTQKQDTVHRAFDFSVAVGLATAGAEATLRTQAEAHGHRLAVFSAQRMKTISTIVREEGYPMNWRVFNALTQGSQTAECADCPDYDPTTVWLGHKIANVFGSIPTFLTPVLREPVCRQVIDDAEGHAAQANTALATFVSASFQKSHTEDHQL